jgi:hypothetical protein
VNAVTGRPVAYVVDRDSEFCTLLVQMLTRFDVLAVPVEVSELQRAVGSHVHWLFIDATTGWPYLRDLANLPLTLVVMAWDTELEEVVHRWIPTALFLPKAAVKDSSVLSAILRPPDEAWE